MKVYVRKDKHGNRVLHYSYRVNADMAFCFNLFEEVGLPYQKEAEFLRAKLCKETNSRVKTVEIGQSPWYVDVLIKNAEGAA